MNARRVAVCVLVFTGYLALWIAVGFVIAVFSTNPPPPVPGCESMIEFGRYCAFGICSLIIGLLIGRSLSRAFRPLERS